MNKLTEGFQVGDNYYCTISWDGSSSEVTKEWKPDIPLFLTNQMERDYHKGKNKFEVRRQDMLKGSQP